MQVLSNPDMVNVEAFLCNCHGVKYPVSTNSKVRAQQIITHDRAIQSPSRSRYSSFFTFNYLYPIQVFF